MKKQTQRSIVGESVQAVIRRRKRLPLLRLEITNVTLKQETKPSIERTAPLTRETWRS